MKNGKRKNLEDAAKLIESRYIMSRNGLLVENYNYDEKDLTELKTQTYADLMNKTENYPWDKFLSQDDDKENPRKKYNKKQRINDLARERFESDFLKEFPKRKTMIKTNLGAAEFYGIKFNANYTSYDLLFTLVSSVHGRGEYKNIWITKSGTDGYYILYNNDGAIKLEPESEPLVKKMLSYNFGFGK